MYFKRDTKTEIFDTESVVPIGEWIYLVSRIDGVVVTDVMIRANDVAYVKRLPDRDVAKPPRAGPVADAQHPAEDPPPPSRAPRDRPIDESLPTLHRAILQLRAQGLSQADIARRVELSDSGLDYHWKKLRERFGLNGHELTALAISWYPPNLEQPLVELEIATP